MLEHYLSFEEILSEAGRLCAGREGASLETYGQSVEGRPLRVARVPGGDSRTLVLIAGVHGLEVIGPAVALRFLQRVTATPYAGTVAVVLVANPDAYVRCWESGGTAPYVDMRQNARGVDLNRNFPLPRGARPSRWPYAGSSRPSDVAYRGRSPLSEPESKHLATTLEEIRPHAALSLHSFGGVLIHPPARDRTTWRTYGHLARSFRSGSGRRSYRRLGSPWGDPFTGELEDWLHYALGCWATCVELHPLWDSIVEVPLAANWAERFNPRSPETRLEEMTDGVSSWFAHARELSPLSPCPQSSVTAAAW